MYFFTSLRVKRFMRSINFTSIDWRMKIFLIKEKEKSLKSMQVFTRFYLLNASGIFNTSNSLII